MLVKRPGTSAIAVIALALGIGLTTVMFSIVQGAILRGLPFEGGDRLMLLSRAPLTNQNNRQWVTLHDFVDWRARQQSFEGLAGFSQGSAVISGDAAFPERVGSARMTPNMLSLLRVRLVRGRDLNEADAAPGAPAVVLIGHRVWTSRFGGEASVIGREIRIDGTPTTIVGVLPESFGFPQTGELWLPMPIEPPAERGRGGTVRVIGRLREGVSQEQAAAELRGIAGQLAQEHEANREFTARLGPFVKESIGDDVVSTLFTMLGAVFGVMLVACVNVTNLQLARAVERTKEVAIRTALGAGRWRIIRQLLAEGVLLSAVGALLGIGIAKAGTAAFMRAIVDTQPPFWIDVRIDPTVLAFVTAITVTTALVSSVLPGWRIARADVNAAHKDETRGTTGVRMGLFSRWLVVVEVTASCVLLVVSGLMIRSILQTSRFDYPFATEDVFVAQVSLPGATEAAQRSLQIEQLEQRLARVPGASAVALATSLPGQTGSAPISVEGAEYASEDERPRAGRVSVTTGFFDALRVTPKAGRGFTDEDRVGALPVAIVDDTFARLHLAGGPPLGRRFRYGDDTQPWITVVGVVPDLNEGRRTGQPTATAYLPIAQGSPSSFAVVVSTPNDPLAMTSAVRAAVAEVNDRAPVSRPNSLSGELWQQGWPFRVFGGLFLMFGIAALVLAAAGLYGVMSFSVRRRTQEIGVRLALGASRGTVLRMVLWQGFWRVAVGVVAGLVPGWLVGRMMVALLANVDAADPVVHIATAGTLLTAGTLACLAPALRAASVDPLTALRRD
jgi:predicted permease